MLKLVVAGAFAALVAGALAAGVGKQAIETVLGFAVADAHAGQCGPSGGGKGWGWGWGKWKKKGRH